MVWKNMIWKAHLTTLSYCIDLVYDFDDESNIPVYDSSMGKKLLKQFIDWCTTGKIYISDNEKHADDPEEERLPVNKIRVKRLKN
jgi:hypothetical protein